MQQPAKEQLATIWTEDRLHEVNEQFHEQPVEVFLDWALKHFATKITLTCSFSNLSGMVLLHMICRFEQKIPIIFLDTDLLFPETYTLIERVVRQYNIIIDYHRPKLSLQEQDRQEGPGLFARNPDRCCSIRKVEPLSRALQPYHAWISGIRQDQAPTRTTTRLIEWNSRYKLLKLNPLAFWSRHDVWEYIHTKDIPYNSLLDQGYTSIGCIPCTQPNSTDDERAGRWAQFAKTECGIHLR